MAAADLDTRIVAGFDNFSPFLTTDVQKIPTTSAPTGSGQGGTNGTQNTLQLEADRFPLQDDSFVNLQKYLKAAMKLPADEASFRVAYPQELFDTYMKKDTGTPVLYVEMWQTLTTIHKNCFNFQKGTMNGMMILAGEISSFGWETSKGVDKIASSLEIVLTPGASFTDTRVRDAADEISNALEMLQAKAGATKTECRKIWDGLSEFKEYTRIDKDKLKTLTSRTDAVLPTMAHLNSEMRTRADTTYTNLNNLARDQNKLISKIENKTGTKWYYFIPWVGMGLAIADTVSKSAAEAQLALAQREYRNIFNDANAQLAATITFRERCKHLNDNMSQVTEAIKQAESAIYGMMDAFTNLQVGLSGIVTDLDLAKGNVSDEMVRRRKAARGALDRAKDTWAKVADLAQRFQQKGMVLEKNVDDLSETPEPNPWLEVVSANYGGVDVSQYAKVLFNYGDSIRIRTIEPGFEEPWKNVVKSISVFHQLGKSQRIFSCKEYSGDRGLHILGPKKNIADEKVKDAELSLINPLNAPNDSRVKILCIIWGPSEVRKQAVYDYCYSKLNNGPIDWNNANMGGDTWGNNFKSGVIYYQIAGSSDIKQCSGREYTSAKFEG